MASIMHPQVKIIFLLLVLACFELSTSSHVLKGSVACLDCKDDHHDLSGIQIIVKCNSVKKLASAYTSEDGTFQAELPSDEAPPKSYKCLAKILAAPSQLYVSKKDSASFIDIKAQDIGDNYALANPLKFYKSCPLKTQQEGKCGNNKLGSSKTVDLPLPRDWGFAPSSYYVPFFPIIGIP